MVFHFGANFHVSLDQQDLQIWSHIKSSFHFGLDFHVSSDSQIRELEYHEEQLNGFFILVLIFMYLPIIRMHEFRGTLIAAEWVFVLVQLKRFSICF